MTELVQSLVTIVLFILILGGLVLIHELGHFVTARWARVRVLEFGIGFPPRAKVLGRGKPDRRGRSRRPLRAARAAAGRSSPGSDEAAAFLDEARAELDTRPARPVHAQLAADRRLRQARGRGRRQRRRPALVRRAPAAGQARHPGRRRRDEPRCWRSLIFTGIALSGEPADRRPVRRGRSRARPRRPPASWPATRSSRSTASSTRVLRSRTECPRRPPGPRRRDRRRSASCTPDGDRSSDVDRSTLRDADGSADAGRARHQRGARASTVFYGTVQPRPAEAVQIGGAADGRRRSG